MRNAASPRSISSQASASADEVEPGAAVRLGDHDAEEPELRHALRSGRGRAGGRCRCCDCDRQDPLVDEGAHGVLEQALLDGELEVHGPRSLIACALSAHASSDRRARARADAAVAFNWSWVAQHSITSQLPRLTVRHPRRSLGILFSHRGWVVAFVVGIVGWVFYVVAVRFAPLSLVQADLGRRARAAGVLRSARLGRASAAPRMARRRLSPSRACSSSRSR